VDPSRPPPVPDDPAAGATDRLAAQVGFVLEADRLKSVLRRGHLADGSRLENSAEHSWTLALMAIVLAEHAAEPVDLATVLRMVVVHDIVEVDAGDTYVYDDAANSDRAEREERAADRIFGLLPPDRAAELSAMAFVFAYETARDATLRSLHIHGGYGFGMEGDIQLYYRRARGWALVYAEPPLVLDRVADARYGPVAAR